MGAVRKAGAFLIALGVLAVVAGFVMGAAPEVVERSVTVPHTDVVLDNRFTVGPLRYTYVRFDVPYEAESAFLDVDVVVYRGNDIDLEVYHGGSKIFEVRVRGGYSDTITLPGPGSYEVRFDNSYSILTSKDVEARVVLRWSELKVERQEITRRSSDLMTGGIMLIIAGAVAYLVGGRAGPKVESVDAVLLDLASRKPPVEGGPEARTRLKLEPKGLGSRDVSRLIDVVAKSRRVRVEAYKPRLRTTYTLEISGPREAVVAAAKDIVEFCERTGKCRASFESI